MSPWSRPLKTSSIHYLFNHIRHLCKTMSSVTMTTKMNHFILSQSRRLDQILRNSFYVFLRYPVHKKGIQWGQSAIDLWPPVQVNIFTKFKESPSRLSLDLEECDRQTNGQTTRKHNGQAMTIASTEALKCYKGNHNFYINGHFYTYIGQT